MTNEETISEENTNDEPLNEDIQEDSSDKDLEETLKKRLELELGLPLTPKSVKKIERNYNDDLIIVENFPIQEICVLKIGGNTLTSEDYCLNESEGIIYLNKRHNGLLYLQYTYGLDESEYSPILDLMIEHENDTSWTKNASSISEKNVTVSYDTSQGTGARIQSMIQDLRNKYSCYVEMI